MKYIFLNIENIDIMPIRGFLTSHTLHKQMNIEIYFLNIGNIDIMPERGFCTSQTLGLLILLKLCNFEFYKARFSF